MCNESVTLRPLQKRYQRKRESKKEVIMDKIKLNSVGLRRRAREGELLDRLAGLPLASVPPPMDRAIVNRLALAIRVYPPHIYRAITERAERYDAAWGLRGESEIAAFLDFQCLRRIRSLRTFVPDNRKRAAAWREVATALAGAAMPLKSPEAAPIQSRRRDIARRGSRQGLKI